MPEPTGSADTPAPQAPVESPQPPTPDPQAQTPADASPPPETVRPAPETTEAAEAPPSPPVGEAAPTTTPPAAPQGETPPAEGAPEVGSALIVRYGLLKHIGEFRHNLGGVPAPGTKVVVRTERGVELAEVVIGIAEERTNRTIPRSQLTAFLQASSPEYAFQRGGRVLRLANPQDVIDQRHLETSAKEEGAYCRQQIRELGLPMRLVTVEHLLGGERIIFYFSSETRVDFRELVRRLASQFRTRIEMRQVGARDEARLVADFERCGQQCCCQLYLKDLKPVSMRMAKTQKATLDPSKISGRCGRLMCCLRHEDATYEDLRTRLPRKNTWVRTEEGVGKVIDTQILTQLVRVLMPGGSQTVIANEEILQRDVPPPPVPARPEVEEEPQPRPQPRMLRDEATSPPEARLPEPEREESPRTAEPESQVEEALRKDHGEEAAPPPEQPREAPQAPPSQPGEPGPRHEGRRGRRRRHGRPQPGQPSPGGQRQAQAPQAQPRPPAPPRPPGPPTPAGQAPSQAPGQEHHRDRRRRRRRRHGPGQGQPPPPQNPPGNP
jgi:cell fate regulator YaaT (PSP1 superfamily)